MKLKSILFLALLLLASCITNTTPADAKYKRFSCGGTGGFFGTIGLAADIKYEQVTTDPAGEINDSDLVYLADSCEGQAKLDLISEVLSQ